VRRHGFCGAPATGAERAVSGYLTLRDGSNLAVHHGFVLGRVPGCDLVIDDTKASRRHARLIVEAGVVEIEDLDSSNGTLLNEKPVTRRVLRDGDRVQIGKTVVVYHDGALPGAAPRTGAAAAAVFADDDDLLGGPAAPVTPATPATSRGLGSSPPSSPPSSPRSSPPSSPPSAPPPPPPAPRPNVVEFADEVVAVRRSEPAAGKAGPAGPKSAPAAAPGGPRILQFQKKGPGSGGLLGDDMGQLSPAVRGLLLLGVAALAVGLVWLTMRLMG
jgi:predicted component of type VI protein secretion system